MSNNSNRNTTPGESSVETRLARLLDASFLPQVVPHLPPETLHQLIRHRGLDACGELVAAATPAQLTSLLDIDLWRPQADRDERFDIERFGEWIAMLVDSGEALAARTVAALDQDVVVAGLARYVRVFDPGIFEPTAQTDDESVQRFDAMREGDSSHGEDETDRLECEVAGYIIRARRTDAWDAIIALLVALEDGHEDCFHAVMRGCRLLSNSRPEEDGFHALLQAPEQHLHEVAVERDQRRARQGYATAGDARAFLKLARTRSTSSPVANPIATAYFRSTDDASTPVVPVIPTALPAPEAPAASELFAVVELLTEAGMMPNRPRALLEAGPADPRTADLAGLRRVLAHARDTSDAVYLSRMQELGFLANTLVSGCSIQSRSFTPAEASDAAAAICNLGVEYWPDSVSASLSRDHSLVSVFEVGWSVLYERVSLFVTDRLIDALRDLRGIDRDLRLELVALRRALEHQRDAGTPWRAREATEAIAVLDQAAWVSLRGLLDECPVVPAAMMAILDGHTTTVSPLDFDFISTAGQIGKVQHFMKRLPSMLAA